MTFGTRPSRQPSSRCGFVLRHCVTACRACVVTAGSASLTSLRKAGTWALRSSSAEVDLEDTACLNELAAIALSAALCERVRPSMSRRTEGWARSASFPRHSDTTLRAASSLLLHCCSSSFTICSKSEEALSCTSPSSAPSFEMTSFSESSSRYFNRWSLFIWSSMTGRKCARLPRATFPKAYEAADLTPSEGASKHFRRVMSNPAWELRSL
mmetsp:Transcript_3954/g.10985  ORF Transcript_3954/g.10985 Transcript_3954/m.10985 type:complete len:212 (-) Transcript_3954:2494-3129(-)